MLLALAVTLSTGIAEAEEYVVSQKKKTFEPKRLQAKIGDTVVFVNDDRYAHNLFSDTPGHQFNIRKQMPGDRDVITLEKAGEFVVRCVIHPRMKITIVVE